MAIERSMIEGVPVDGNPMALPVDFQLPDEFAQASNVLTEDDGSVVIDFSPQGMLQAQPAHDDNLAEFMEEGDLREVALDLTSKYESDRLSRREWERTYIKGLELLGLKFEERSKPWDGACGVFHPLLTESVVRFQAQTIQEIFPASGPAKAKAQGKASNEQLQQQHRVVNYLNYLTTSEMTEYRPETESLLFSLPIAGSAFRKVYFDPSLGRPAAMFVPAEDFVVTYGASDLETCERATHVMKKTSNQIRKMQVSGFYRDVEIGDAAPETSDIQDALDDLTGESKVVDFDDRHTLLEMMVDYDLPGFEDPDGIGRPYIITIDQSSSKVLSIRRNWIEDDPFKVRRQHYVHYKYLPGPGFYGLGLTHVIGGIAKSTTSILRQLVDAGTLSNLPGGLKSRGLKIEGNDTPIMPGEFRDVDVYSGNIKDNLTFLPHKEPSTVLYQLLGDLVQEGRRFASAADVKVADMNGEAPVGTTLAILEREMKIISAVHARVHYAMGRELVLLSFLVRDFGPEQYPYELDGEFSPLQDFDDRVDIIPVSDPNAGTMAQRIMQHQAALQLSATAPQLYDLKHLHRKMLEALNIEDADKIVPTDDDMVPLDPITENMNFLKGKPVKAFSYQDHESHIRAHLAMGQNPQLVKMMENNPQAEVIMAAGFSHINEHLAYLYRRKIEQELGVQLPPEGEPLPEDIEYRLSKLVADAAEQLTGKAQQQAQAEENARIQEDPIIQMRLKELGIKERKQKLEEVESMAEKVFDAQKHQDEQISKERDRELQRDLKTMDVAAQQESEKNRKGTEEFKAGVSVAQKAMDTLKKSDS